MNLILFKKDIDAVFCFLTDDNSHPDHLRQRLFRCIALGFYADGNISYMAIYSLCFFFGVCQSVFFLLMYEATCFRIAS